MANDGHDTTITFAASWGRTFLTPVLNNTYFMNNTFIVLTFNKSDTYTMHNTVYTILLGGAIAGHENIVDDTFYNHFSILTSVELNWDLPSLGRWDCGANVLQVVSNATGYKNAVVDTTKLRTPALFPIPNIFPYGQCQIQTPGVRLAVFWTRLSLPGANLQGHTTTRMSILMTMLAGIIMVEPLLLLGRTVSRALGRALDQALLRALPIMGPAPMEVSQQEQKLE